PLFLYLKSEAGRPWIKKMEAYLNKPQKLYIFIVPLYLAEAFIEPFFNETHALIGDWFVLTSSGFLFLFGFLLMTIKDQFWALVTQYRRRFLYMGMIGFTLLLGIFIFIEDSTIV